MNIRIILKTIGAVLNLTAALLLLPLACALYFKENPFPYINTMVIALFSGLILSNIKTKAKTFFAKEGFVTVGLVWICIALVSAIPFVLSKDIPNYIDAFFETVSGLTTTGATCVTNIEALTRAGLFWRSFTHWIGGMGVLVFITAILPKDSDSVIHIMRAEVPGPSLSKLVPKLGETARILYMLYIFLTITEAIILKLCGMSAYEALLHAFATAGTGGFSTRNASIAAFHSKQIEWIIGVFMLLFAANFNLFFFISIRKFKLVFKNEELRWYIAIVIIATLLITVGIMPDSPFKNEIIYSPQVLRQMRNAFVNIDKTFPDAIRDAFFHVSSIISTTGFTTKNYVAWPVYTHYITLILMLIGGCAGGTGGGPKVSRVVMLVKSIFSDVESLVNPHVVPNVSFEGKYINKETKHSIYLFFVLYILILSVGVFFLTLNGFDLETTFSSALTCISNVGPGLGLVGPMGNYSIYTGFSKIVLSMLMLFGRLEIYAMLILFSPKTWKYNS